MYMFHTLSYMRKIYNYFAFCYKNKTKKKQKKKKRKTDHLSKSAKLLLYSSQEKLICPVSLANSFSSQTKSSRPSFCHLDGQLVLNVISFQPSLTRLRTS